MNPAFDARIRELEADVRKGQGAYESRLVTILMAANGAAMVTVFNATVSGRLASPCAFTWMTLLFAGGAAAAFIALVRAYATGRELNQLLAEVVMISVNRPPMQTADEKLAEELQYDEHVTKIEAINKRGEPFTHLLTASGVLFLAGILAAIILLIDPNTLAETP